MRNSGILTVGSVSGGYWGDEPVLEGPGSDDGAGWFPAGGGAAARSGCGRRGPARRENVILFQVKVN
jgi:hypothetical protein